MTRETKIGLLVGMGVIILIGILISDHLSVAQRQQQAQLAQTMPEFELDDEMLPPPLDPQGGYAPGLAGGGWSDEPLPMPEQYASAESERPSPRTRETAAEQEADVFRQDISPPLYRAEAPQRREPAPPQQQASPPTARLQGEAAGQTAGEGQQLPPGFERVNSGGSDSGRQQPTRAALNGDPEPLIHHVQSGETLWDIARRYYDDTQYWRTIYEANRDVIPNPNGMRSGVRLRIPNKAGRANADQARTGSHTTDSPQQATRAYTVQSGDNLSRLAQRFYGSPGAWRQLKELNEDRIDDPDRLSPGLEIRVPAR